MFPVCYSNVWKDMTHIALHCDQEYCCDIDQPGRGNCKESQSRWGKSAHEDTRLSEITCFISFLFCVKMIILENLNIFPIFNINDLTGLVIGWS